MYSSTFLFSDLKLFYIIHWQNTYYSNEVVMIINHEQVFPRNPWIPELKPIFISFSFFFTYSSNPLPSKWLKSLRVNWHRISNIQNSKSDPMSSFYDLSSPDTMSALGSLERVISIMVKSGTLTQQYLAMIIDNDQFHIFCFRL